MRTLPKLFVAGMMLAAPILMGAGSGSMAAPVLYADDSPVTTARDASDCFSCYEGGIGNPVICYEAWHFDKPSIPGNFMGTPHGDQECIPSLCEEDHTPFCEPGELVAAVEDAMRAGDLEALQELVHERKTIRVDDKTSSLRVLDCHSRSTVARFRLTQDQLKRLMSP